VSTVVLMAALHGEGPRAGLSDMERRRGFRTSSYCLANGEETPAGRGVHSVAAPHEN